MSRSSWIVSPTMVPSISCHLQTQQGYPLALPSGHSYQCQAAQVRGLTPAVLVASSSRVWLVGCDPLSQACTCVGFPGSRVMSVLGQTGCWGTLHGGTPAHIWDGGGDPRANEPVKFCQLNHLNLPLHSTALCYTDTDVRLLSISWLIFQIDIPSYLPAEGDEGQPLAGVNTEIIISVGATHST